MRRTVVSLVATLAVTLPACANKFYTAKLGPDLDVERSASGKRKEIDGVLVYPPKRVRLDYELTAFTDAAGNVLATSDGALGGRCLPQQKIEYVTQPDYSQPHALRHVPSPFASGSLKVELENGMIKSVNSESDPQLDETISALATLTESAAGAAVLGMVEQPAEPGVKVCNARPVLKPNGGAR